MEFVELQKVYRSTTKIIDLLNSVRNNTITEKVWHFSSKVHPQFEPAPGDFYVYLTTTNAMAKP